MKELVEKLEELEKEEKKILLEQQEVLERIIRDKNEKNDFFDDEIKYSENKNKLKRIRKKKMVLNDAMDVLEGIDLDEL